MAIATVCGAECGIAPASTPGTSADQHWRLVFGTTLPTQDTAHVRTGTRAWKFVPGAVAPYIQHQPIAATNNVVGLRMYGYFDVLPAVTENLCQVTTAVGASLVINVTSAGVLKAGNVALGLVTGGTITAGTWWGVEYQVDLRANPNVAYFRTDVGDTGVWTDHGSINLAQALTTIAQFRLGLPGATTGTENLWLDDIVLYGGTTLNEHYPLGSGFVKGYLPNASLATMVTTGDLKYNDSTNIVNAATDLHTYVDDVDGSGFMDMDASTADFISWNVADGTDDVWNRHAQFQFADSVEAGPPRYVDIISAFRSSSTLANEINERASDDGTNWTAIWGSWSASTNVGYDVSDTTNHFLSKILTTKPSGGAWTTAGFNALRVQVGHSDDISPIPYLDAIGIEAEFVPISGVSVLLFGGL